VFGEAGAAAISMDVEAEAVYVDILRSLQSSILNSASVSFFSELGLSTFRFS
jgi:hypothetical protein